MGKVTQRKRRQKAQARGAKQMAEESVQEKEQRLEAEDTVDEPGRTPGQAEGEDIGAAPYDPAADPGRTPGQAEGSAEMLEGHDLASLPPEREEEGGLASSTASRQAQSAQQNQQRNPQQAATAAQQRAKVSQWEPRVKREEVMRWTALIGGGWLALYGLRHSLGSLTLLGIGGGLLYYALNGKWPVANANAVATESNGL